MERNTMIKKGAILFSTIAVLANATHADSWPAVDVVLVNDSGHLVEVQILQHLNLPKKLVSLKEDENRKVNVKIPMDATIELKDPTGRAKPNSCLLNLRQVLEEGQNELTITSAKCPNSDPMLSCRQSRPNEYK